MTGGWPDDNDHDDDDYDDDDHDDDDCVDNDHDDDDYDDVMVTLLRFALLFLIFSRELETDFGGNMFSRLLACPGSDNKPLTPCYKKSILGLKWTISGINLFCRFLPRQSENNYSRVMFMAKFGPTANQFRL